MKSCKACKQPILPKVQVPGARRQAIVNYVLKHPRGVKTQEIIEAVWTDRSTWWMLERNIVSVNVCAINRALEAQGAKVRIRGTMGPGSVYRAVYL